MRLDIDHARYPFAKSLRIVLLAHSTILTKTEEQFSRLVVFVCLDLRRQLRMGFYMDARTEG